MGSRARSHVLSRRRATSLVEILIAVTFLAVCATAILEAVWSANVHASYALRREVVMSALQDRIEAARSYAVSGSLGDTTTSQDQSFSGFVSPVTVTLTVTREGTSKTLFDVTASATWKEESSLGSRTDSASLSTVIKQ